MHGFNGTVGGRRAGAAARGGGGRAAPGARISRRTRCLARRVTSPEGHQQLGRGRHAAM
jgi:hypothetical protein